MPKRAKTIQQGWVKVTLRLPPEVHRAVEDAAWAQRRSFNAQFVTIVEAWVSAQKED